MILIIIDGGPASGKNTLGNLIVDKFHKLGDKSVLLDLDTYVEKINPTWRWEDKQQENIDQLKARDFFANEISKYLEDDYIVIAIGEKILTKTDLFAFLNKLNIISDTYLYHLVIPLTLRKERLQKRGPHSLIDIEKDQNDRNQIKTWPGYIYKNINSPEKDAKKLFEFIKKERGLIKRDNIRLLLNH